MPTLQIQNELTTACPAAPVARSREIFLAALEHADQAARGAFVDEACVGDLALHDAVDGLLAEQETLGSFLQEPAMAGMRDGATTPRESAGEPSEHIGPYKLLQKIGEGGCGRVYMAEQLEPVRRRVALKVIKLGMDTRSVIARFESERQALALMDHTSIARVLDAGATDTGRPYFVMELVRGIPITDYCDKENLSARERLAIFIQVSNAIQHAHQKGIIHRDIKPSNILVTLHDGVPVPKIIDFGIAKATEQRLTDKTLFTEYQSFIGTPAYMSPEQAEMSGLDIDTRSDIYALGVLLYELLIGKTPFDAQMLRESGLDECRRTIRESEPATPSTRLATMLGVDQSEIARHRRMNSLELVHLLRGDLDWIVMKCLEKDRRRRYETVHDLVLDIQRHLDGQAVLARPPSTLYRLQKLVRRHRWAFAAAACLLATLIAGVAVSTWQMLRAQDAERIADEATQNQTRLLAEAEQGWNSALTNARAARVNTYVADINLTQHALNEGNFGRAIQLIDRHRPVKEDDPDLRGFEWRYLAGMCRGDVHNAYPNQNGAVHALAVSPDGELLAAGTPDLVNIWDMRSQSLVTTLPTGGDRVEFLADGETLVTSGKRSIHTWDLRSFTERTKLPMEEDSVISSPDGSWLATRRGDGIQILDAETMSPQVLLNGASPPVVFSFDSDRIATKTQGGLAIWNAKTGTLVRELENSAGLVGANLPGGRLITFSLDGKQVIAPCNRSTDRGVFILNVWDTATGKEMDPMPSNPDVTYHTGVISCMALSSDGRTLATGSWDHSISLWDLATRQHLTTLRGQSNEIWSVAFSADGKLIIAGGKDGSLNAWPVETMADGDVIEGQWRPLEISGNGKHLAALGLGGHVGFFDLGSRQMTHSIELSTQPSGRGLGGVVDISADLGTLVHGIADGRVQIWSVQTRKIMTLETGMARIGSVKISPDGRYLVVGDRSKPLTVWDLRHQGGAAPVVTIAAERALFSADSTVLVVVSGRRDGGGLAVWDTSTFEMRPKLDMGVRSGSSIAISPDGQLLATTDDHNSSSNSIRLWDTGSGRLIGECNGHKQSVWSVTFSPDGRTLASSSDDSTLKFWNIETQQEMLSIRRVGKTLTDLRFSPNGRWLVAAASPFTTNGYMRLLQAPSFDEIDRWLHGPDQTSLSDGDRSRNQTTSH